MEDSSKSYQSTETPSFLLKNLKSRTLTTRNEKDIRKFLGDTDNTTEGTENAPGNVNNVIMGIMKQSTFMETPEKADSDANDALLSRWGPTQRAKLRI